MYTKADVDRKVETRVKLELLTPGEKRIVYFLAESPRSTNQCIAQTLNMTQQTASSHLSDLLKKKLLGKEKRGREVFWHISDSDLLIELRLLLANPETNPNNFNLLFQQ